MPCLVGEPGNTYGSRLLLREKLILVAHCLGGGAPLKYLLRTTDRCREVYVEAQSHQPKNRKTAQVNLSNVSSCHLILPD